MNGSRREKQITDHLLVCDLPAQLKNPFRYHAHDIGKVSLTTLPFELGTDGLPFWFPFESTFAGVSNLSLAI